MSDPRHDDVEIDQEDVERLSFFGASTYKPWPSIPHYYGDPTRQFLLAVAALMLLASPLYGNNLKIEFPFEIIGALLCAGIAALISPRSRRPFFGSAIISGVGMVVYSTWGIFEYDSVSPIAFVLRLVIAVIFLFIFYLSMKTYRAFTLHQIGRRETVDEFETEEERVVEEVLERETVGPPPLVGMDQDLIESEQSDEPEPQIKPGHHKAGNTG